MNLTRSAVGAVVASALLLSACSSSDGDSATLTPDGSIEVTTSQAPQFEAKEADPITSTPDETVVDPGLNVEFTFQGASYGSSGGTVITVLVKNLNEAPLPTDALGQPVLAYNSGGGSMTEAETLNVDGSDQIVGLDHPLGSQASTNLSYVYNVSTGNMWDAEFRIGNVTFRGNLN